jgi:hypothetical protein
MALLLRRFFCRRILSDFVGATGTDEAYSGIVPLGTEEEGFARCHGGSGTMRTALFRLSVTRLSA